MTTRLTTPADPTPRVRSQHAALEALIDRWRSEAARLRQAQTLARREADVYESCANAVRAVLGSPT